eukprot:scaffold7052_cov254-Pinguiococcus_pyrenoidosus.AAC.21
MVGDRTSRELHFSNTSPFSPHLRRFLSGSKGHHNRFVGQDIDSVHMAIVLAFVERVILWEASMSQSSDGTSPGQARTFRSRIDSMLFMSSSEHMLDNTRCGVAPCGSLFVAGCSVCVASSSAGVRVAR